MDACEIANFLASELFMYQVTQVRIENISCDTFVLMLNLMKKREEKIFLSLQSDINTISLLINLSCFLLITVR